MTMDVYVTAAAVLESIGYDSNELVSRCGDFKHMVRTFQTVEQTKRYISNVMGTAIDRRRTGSAKSVPCECDRACGA